MLFLMYRMELKVLFLEEGAKWCDNTFLMYRMELKGMQGREAGRGFLSPLVPNVPYGVESNKGLPCEVSTNLVPNVPYGVER